MFKSKEDELKTLTNKWVDKTFNFISLSNAEKVLDNALYEYIETNQTEDTAEDFVNDYGYQDEYKESELDDYLEFCRENHEDEFAEYADGENYPIWNTLFEFRNEPSEKIIEKAQEAGFGIIAKNDNYNTMLFVRGAGYSFYAQHWIPMYLELPWVNKEEYKEVRYSHL